MIYTIFLLLLAADPAAFGPGGRFQLERSKDDFGARSHGIIETIEPNQKKFYPLPQSTEQQFIQLRPEDLKRNPFNPGHYERQEVIGPTQIEGGRIWFGNNYYDSEGMTGVGAFGYFDTATRTYTLFSPPEVAPYEISALLVQPDAVWLGLDQFVEDISTVPGGLVRWDRTTHHVRRYPLEFAVDNIRVQGDELRLKTHDGYAFFQNGTLRRFLNEGTPISKFPPPPTHN